jgi:hypothetical protein
MPRSIPLAIILFFCSYFRQSQLASQGPSALAEMLTQSLRRTGDLDLVDIDMEPYVLTSSDPSANPPHNPTRAETRSCHGMMTKSCFRRREDLSLPSRSCSLSVYQFSVCLVAHKTLVSDARWYPLHAAPDALLGIHTPTRTDRRHRKSAREAVDPHRTIGEWSQWRAALPDRRFGCTSRTFQRLGDSRAFRYGEWECTELLCHAT